MDAALFASFGLVAAALLVGAAILRAAERAHPTEPPREPEGRGCPAGADVGSCHNRRMQDAERCLREEVEGLHAFFVDWFAGALPDDDVLFARRFRARFEPGFEIVEPSGKRLGLTDIAAGIRAGHGTNPHWTIVIREMRLVATAGELSVVTYEEHQTGAKTTERPDNTRISTAVFRWRHGEPRWLHLHETWCAPA